MRARNRIRKKKKTIGIHVYNKNGLLTEVKNQYTAIKLERDKSGRIQKEWQDNHWVASDYDSSGNRLAVSSSFGANILSKRDKMGQVTHMVAYLNKEKPWCARMEYNVTGQEVARKVSGGVIGNFSYDEAGRPVQHMIRGQKESIHRHRRYEWDVNYRLKKVTNELTKGNIIYSYDRFSNLISARGTEILSCFRMFDEAGNVYGTEDKSDRIYGAGSRLETSGIDLKEKRNIYQGGHGRLVTKGAEYFYDEEGNLVRKTEADGSIWEYSYYGNGMLRKVVRPDKSAVIFKYDGLGRRIEKSITRAGSEKVIPFARKEAAWEESKWETIGGVRIRRPNTELQKFHMLQGDNTSVYRGENALQPGSEQKASHVEKVIKFLWDGNVLLHEWQEDADESKKPIPQIEYQADYLGTPAEAYDDSGTLVWKRELDINGKVMPAGKDRYGRTMEDIGEKNFIPFRFQGQYTQQDPIGLAGGNPTLYGYVYDTLGEIDSFGLTWKDILDSGLGHHIFPRAIAKKLGIVELSDELSIAWFPNNSANTGELHQLLHRVLSDKGVPYHGSKYTGNLEEFWKLAEEAYDGIDTKGYLKLPKTQNTKIYRNLTPKEALLKIKELYENGDLPTRCR